MAKLNNDYDTKLTKAEEPMNWENEYKALVNELARHLHPEGRYVSLQGYYSYMENNERVPVVKLSESPAIYKAVSMLGAVEGVEGGYRTLAMPQFPDKYPVLISNTAIAKKEDRNV